MKAELAVLKLVAERLEGAKLTYMVSGSMAMNFHAQPRMTRDIDLVIELNCAAVPLLVSLFQDDFYCDPEEVRDAVSMRGMFNLVHLDTVVKVDFIVRKETAFRRQEIARRRRLSVAGFDVWLVSAEDLILSKLVWASESRSDFQLRDVRNLLRSVADLDRPYLERWAADLGVSTLLGEVRR